MATIENICKGCKCIKSNNDYKCVRNINGIDYGCEFRGLVCPVCRNCGKKGSSSNNNSSNNNSSNNNSSNNNPISDSFQIVSKISCTNEDNTCNFRPPFSELSLYGKKSSTGEKYTELERNEKIGQYKNMCKLRGDNSLDRCCDPNDEKLNNLYNRIPDSVKNKYPLIIPKDNNGVTEYKVCTETSSDECKNAVVPSTYNYCKMLHPDVEYDKQTKTLKNLANDCITASCSNDSLYPFISDPYSNKFSNYEDFNLVENLKKDNVDGLLNYFKTNPKTKYSSVLKYGYPGNTTLHECIIYKADKCIEELLTKKLDLTIKNKDGNTVLHLASLDGNTNLIYNLLKVGADINIRNNKGDVAIHCAVRSASYGTTMVLISNGASLFQLNSAGESPLFIAVTAKKRTMKIIELLVEMGSHLLVINTDGNSMLKIIQDREKNMLSEQIRTYIQRAFYEQNKDNYKSLIRQYPEYSIMDMTNFMEYDEEGDPIGVKELPDLNIEYPDEFETKDIYKETISTPIKINMPQYKELYGDDFEKEKEPDYSQHSVKQTIPDPDPIEQDEAIIESFIDFNTKNNKQCKINWIAIPVLFIVILIALLFMRS